MQENLREPLHFKMGDKVRSTLLRNVFSREYDDRWSGEIFTLSRKVLRGSLPLYRTKYCKGKDIKGSFYES